jgi:ABC-type multidrug transport system fused ATPase/permease subunit
LLRSIIGCEAVLEGCVRVGGVDVACADLAGLRRRVVIVPSDGFLLADSVDGNLRYQQKPLLDEDIRRLASLTGSLRCIEKRPNGFDTFVGFEGRDFSLGERQRIALTRALLQGPEVLVLDEATSGIPLDEEMSLLSEIRRSTTVKTLILVTHRLSSATLADRILVLDDGRLIHSGSPAEILTTAPLVARRGEFAREHAFVETT